MKSIYLVVHCDDNSLKSIWETREEAEHEVLVLMKEFHYKYQFKCIPVPLEVQDNGCIFRY